MKTTELLVDSLNVQFNEIIAVSPGGSITSFKLLSKQSIRSWIQQANILVGGVTWVSDERSHFHLYPFIPGPINPDCSKDNMIYEVLIQSTSLLENMAPILQSIAGHLELYLSLQKTITLI